MNKQWKINKKAPKEFLEKFPEYSKLTLQLLWDRNLTSQKQIDEFFNPDYDQDLHDPFLLKDIKKALKRIEKASRKKEKVAIFADYDADGICGAVLLKEILNVFKIEPETYIPDRNKEGYGLSLKGIEELAEKKVSLILTIDCGITDFEEVKLANRLGIEVIIIDHHEIPASSAGKPKLPSAFAIINPKQKKCKYPFKYLAATGVAFKLVQAVCKIKKLPISWEKWLLDLVAIATITDSMILLGENRTLVNYGLIVLSQTKRIGLQKLMEKARIKPVFNPQTLETNLNTYTLGFILGPRLNAASRIDHGIIAYNLLISQTKNQADELAQKLESKNQERQKQMEKILKEAREKVLKNLEKRKIIFEGDEKWTAGIVGLIAQKLTEEFWRPAFIYQKTKEFSTGSARSIPEFDLIKILYRCQKFLKEFGGHHEAAGFKVLNENLDNFRRKLEKESSEELEGKNLVPILNIDAEIFPEEITWSVFKEVQRFAPFQNSDHIGKGNSTPLFLMKGLTIYNIKNVGSKANHLKMVLQKNEKKFIAIGFGLSGFCDRIRIGDKIDIVFELISNEWDGTKELQLKIIDLKKV